MQLTREVLEYKEQALRDCFMERLERLDTDGTVSLAEVKELKTYGALWHYVHELLEESGAAQSKQHGTVTADSVSGLKMSK